MLANFRISKRAALVYLLSLATAGMEIRPATATTARSMAEVLADSKPVDWRPLDPENTLYLDLAAGRVVIELAPEFAPLHVANIKKMARAKYYDALSIIRVQDNYVAQWGDPDNRHPIPASVAKVAPEFDAAWNPKLEFAALPDGDVYASQVGFTHSMPMARSAASQRIWLAHCYGMVGVGRDLALDSGSGAEVYVVIGHSPRHLDRNVALVGRVVQGMELLSSLPRGSAEMGFYGTSERPTPIKQIRVAADVPLPERTPLEVLRSDTAIFSAMIESRRNRPEDFFRVPAGHIELCNVPLPVRPAAR